MALCFHCLNQSWKKEMRRGGRAQKPPCNTTVPPNAATYDGTLQAGSGLDFAQTLINHLAV